MLKGNVSEDALIEFREKHPGAEYAIAIPAQLNMDRNTFIVVNDPGKFRTKVGEELVHMVREQFISIEGHPDLWLVLPLSHGRINVREKRTHPKMIVDIGSGKVFLHLCPSCKFYLDCNVAGRLEDGKFEHWQICSEYEVV